MKLTAKNVEAVLIDCLFKEGEDTSNPVIAEGIIRGFGFHHQRLESHRNDIKEMLSELPDEFHTDKGGGWSFLNACMTRDGVHWGEHMNIEQLLVLGIATGQAKTLMPRDMWKAFPGGMPYFSVNLQEPTTKP